MAYRFFSSAAPRARVPGLFLGLILPSLLFIGCYGNTFGAEYETCAEVEAAIDKEITPLQSCSVDADCGTILEGTSCGCTNDLVARKDVNLARFRSLKLRGEELGCAAPTSDCGCREADGFLCIEGVCGWRFVP